MALPNGDLLLYRVGGATPSDTWSIGMWFVVTGQSGIPSPANMNSAASGVLGGFNTLVWSAATNGLKSFNNSGVTLATASTAYYRNGSLVAAGSASISPVAGTGATNQPNYVARVVSLLTDRPGRSYRGRLYLPWTGQALTAASGLWTSMPDIPTNLATLLSSSTGMQSPGYGWGGSSVADFVVLSRAQTAATPVTSLRMDNKPDTQHGRENRLVASVFNTAAVT